MENEKSHRSVWIVVGILVGVLALCGLSAIVGGAAGYMAGRRAAVRAVAAYATRAPDAGRWPAIPTPAIPIPTTPETEETIPGPQGALITEVVKGSPAEQAGLRVGDIIIAVDGQELTEAEELARLIGEYDPGDQVSLTLFEVGRERTAEVTLGRHPERGGETAYLGIYYRMVPMGQMGMPRFRRPPTGR
ncbi:MAG: PDZ domain-containing protein [Chloroflexota bacterium]